MTAPGDPGLTAARALAALAATWPPEAARPAGPFVIQQAQGGGSRVGAALARGPAGPDAVALAEAAMRPWGSRAFFRITAEDAALDTLLAARGYVVAERVAILAAPVATLIRPRPPVTTFEAWPPLAIQREIWAGGGIDAARLAVMERAPGHKVSILGRIGDRPAGTAFVACDGDCAMLHALEVVAGLRRLGLGGHMLAAAAAFAARQGAGTLALAVTRANAGALQLYSSLGLVEVAGYHYRRLPE